MIYLLRFASIRALSYLCLHFILSCHILTILMPASCLYQIVAILFKEVEAGACCGG